MQVEIPSYVEVKIYYENDYEMCFLCGALCLSDYNQYKIDRQDKCFRIDLYTDEIETFEKTFVYDLKIQYETHSDLLIDYTI